MKLSIITLTYNKLKYTKKFIDSLCKYTSDFELIIVDNGSTDGTVEYLKSLQNIKLILNNENLGFSKGNNQGLTIAKGEYVGFLNNDILLFPNWFEACEEVFKKENAGFVSPRELNPYHENVNIKNYIKLYKNLKYKKIYEKSFDECVFSCVITKRDVLNEIGNFDEKFSPAFFEDNDLKMRAIENGFGVYVANSACFFHYGSITSKKFNNKFEKNRSYYYKKHKFAQYQVQAQEKIMSNKTALNYLNRFPINLIYKFILFNEKVLRNLKRFLNL